MLDLVNREVLDLTLPEAAVRTYHALATQGWEGTWPKVVAVCSDMDAFVSWWKSTDPLVSGAAICTVAALYCLIMAPILDNYSQVDKMWSIIPFVYVWNFAFASNWAPRLVLMSAVSTLWGIRLTYNFWRRGGYAGEEDYRWVYVRKEMCRGNWFLFQLMNIFFIATYQHFLLYAIVFPAHTAFKAGAQDLNELDYVAAGMVVFFILFETIADQQQWTFQNEKYRRINKKEKLTGDYLLGFRTTGLFNYSRHPNYFGEQMVWVSFYIFSLASGAALINWTCIGALNLIALFRSSANFSEGITVKKYPKYKEYQRSRNMFLPFFPSKMKSD